MTEKTCKLRMINQVQDASKINAEQIRSVSVYAVQILSAAVTLYFFGFLLCTLVVILGTCCIVQSNVLDAYKQEKRYEFVIYY